MPQNETPEVQPLQTSQRDISRGQEAQDRNIPEERAPHEEPTEREDATSALQDADKEVESAFGGGGEVERKMPTESAVTDGKFQYFSGSIPELITRAKGAVGGLLKKIIAPVSSRLKADLNARGLDIDNNYKHILDDNAIRHTLGRHAGVDEEKRGQVPITEEDFGRIKEIVEDYDNLIVGRGERGLANIIYSKTYPDGTTVYVEEERRGRKELAAVTMWKTKSPALTDANRTETTPISDLSKASNDKVTQEVPESQAGESVSQTAKQGGEPPQRVTRGPVSKKGNTNRPNVESGKKSVSAKSAQTENPPAQPSGEGTPQVGFPVVPPAEAGAPQPRATESARGLSSRGGNKRPIESNRKEVSEPNPKSSGKRVAPQKRFGIKPTFLIDAILLMAIWRQRERDFMDGLR